MKVDNFEIVAGLMTRLQEHERKVKFYRNMLSENFNPDEHKTLEEFEAAVTVVVAQKYEAIIEGRVRDTVAAALKKAEVGHLEGVKRALEVQVVRELEEALAHLDDANFGLVGDRIREVLEEIRGY